MKILYFCIQNVFLIEYYTERKYKNEKLQDNDNKTRAD